VDSQRLHLDQCSFARRVAEFRDNKTCSQGFDNEFLKVFKRAGAGAFRREAIASRHNDEAPTRGKSAVLRASGRKRFPELLLAAGFYRRTALPSSLPSVASIAPR
jgi:hypothetical protein